MYFSAHEPDKPWYDPNDTEENNTLAKKGFGSFLTFYPYRETDFDKVKTQPFRGSFYLDDIHNSMLMYVQAIENLTSNASVNSLRGCDVTQYMMGKSYQGTGM